MAIQDPQTYKDQFQVERATYLKQVTENPRRAVETLESARKVVTTYNKLKMLLLPPPEAASSNSTSG
jgi:hypothetical protein